MAVVGCPVGAQRQSQRRVCIRFGLLFYRRKQLVALLPVAPEMRQLKVGKVAGMPALGHGNDVVDARRKRMRKLAAEIHRFAADAAHGLCSIDFLFVALKGQTVRAVTVWARNSLWHMRLLGHGLLCTHREGAFAGRETSSGRECFQSPWVLCRPGGIKKAARKIRTAGFRGQCAAARSGSLLGRMEWNPLGCMLPRTEDDAAMTYIYPMTPPGLSLIHS
mgnify:CR=1 FL=1